MTLSITIEKAAHDRFFQLWNSGTPEFQGQRLGQAFYNHFRLDKMAARFELNALYESDGDKAKSFIAKHFTLS